MTEKTTQTNQVHYDAQTEGAHDESLMEQLQRASDNAEGKIQSTAEHIEEKMDEYAEKITKKVESKVNPEVSKKAKSVAQNIEWIADSVEHFVNELGDLIPDVNKRHSRSGVTLEASFHKTVSRLFIFRCLWLIIQVPILYIRGIRASIILVIQLLHMLLLGERNENLWKRLYRFFNHTIKWYAYIFGLVDQQPKIIEDLPRK